MTTLADINKTLTEQNVIQLETRDRVAELGGSFSDFFKMVTEATGDELEAKREQREANKKVKDSVDRSGGTSKGGFFDFDVGNLVPLAGALLGGLLKRGIPALLAAVLADEVGEAVKKLTGSQILGSISEWATLGGAAGFLVGGVKGGIIGALLGAVFSDGAREAIADKLNELIGTELKKDDWQTLAISGGLAAAGLTLPKLVGMLASRMLPLLLSPTGLLVGLAAAIGGLAIAYVTDEKFRESVNKALAPMFLAITDALNSVKDWIKNKINEFLPSFVTTSAEDRAIREQMSKTEAGQKLLEEEASIRGQISEIGGIRAELAGISNTDINAMKALAKRLGINEVYGKKVDNYTADKADYLKSNLMNTLQQRQGFLQGTLKREGGFQEMYDNIEKRLTAEDAAKQQAKRDAELKAKYQTTPLVRGPEIANIQKTERYGEQALGSMASLFNRRPPQMAKTVPPAVPNELLPANNQGGGNTTVVAPVTSQTTIGQSSTAFVGSGTNTIDVNNPQLQKALADMGM